MFSLSCGRLQTEVHTWGRHLGGRQGPRTGGTKLTQGKWVEIISERVKSVVEDGKSAVEVLRGFLGNSVPEIICLHAISVGLEGCRDIECLVVHTERRV